MGTSGDQLTLPHGIGSREIIGAKLILWALLRGQDTKLFFYMFANANAKERSSILSLFQQIQVVEPKTPQP